MMLVIIFIVRVTCHDVSLTWRVSAVHALLLNTLSLLAAQAAKVHVVVVRMRPYAPRRVDGGVHEELVVRLRIEGAHPSSGKRASLIFHRAPVLGRDRAVMVAWNAET